MDSKQEDAKFALYAADSAFFAGVLLTPLFVSAGRPLDALLAFVFAAGGTVYSIYKGQPWPGWAFLKYWRRYL